MAKARLPESQPAEGAHLHLPERRLITGTGPCGGGHVIPAAILRGAGAMPCRGIQGGERDA